MTRKLISMTKKELLKSSIIQSLIDGNINSTDASKQIRVSVRQVKRIKAKVIKMGAAGIIHGNRGRTGNRKIDDEIIKKVKKYLKEKYYNFGPTFASEKLDENHKIKINKETLRGVMTNMGLWQPKPRKGAKKKHFWRPRKENFGEMQQFDGSYHIWFGNEESCLLLSVNDATGKITHAKFDYNEGMAAVFKFWLEYIEKNGLPISIYLDKFSTYKVNHKNAEDNKELMMQFQRAMKQTGVNLITAYSPKAKGRVERMFKTLQDRLVKELKLAGISTTEDANEFLKEYIPKFNEKFAVVPNRKTDLHKKTDETLERKLPQIFSIQNQKVVCNDYTVRFKNQYFQLDKIQSIAVYKKDKVVIEEHLNGEIKINLKERYLDYTVLPERPKKEIDIKLPVLTNKEPSCFKPPANHPWRKQFVIGNKKSRATDLNNKI